MVVGLTTVEGIQLSAANEAVGAARPLVLSDTAILRTLFGDAPLFAANQPQPLAVAIRAAIDEAATLAERSAALKGRREQRWRAQLESALSLAGLR